MITLRETKPVSERTANSETERLFHEIKRTLRLTGTDVSFRVYASYERFLPAMWEAMRPNAETRAFEEASDRLREEAVNAVDGMGRLSVLSRAQLGESQAFQAENALMVHHYGNPKLLVFTSALALALEGRSEARSQRPSGSVELIERGPQVRMAPMELVEDPIEEPAVRKVLRDVKRVLDVQEIPNDYRALALWPKYLVTGWQCLKPIMDTGGYRTTCQRLGEFARELVETLPYPTALCRDALMREGVDAETVLEAARAFERLFPMLILNMSLLVLDWQAPELARRSPFPARPRRAGEER